MHARQYGLVFASAGGAADDKVPQEYIDLANQLADAAAKITTRHFR